MFLFYPRNISPRLEGLAVRSGQQHQYHLVRRDPKCGVDAGVVFGWVMTVIRGMETMFEMGLRIWICFK